MRIEYQGHVREQTYYTHVGYVSAALAQDTEIRGLPQPLPFAMMMAAVLALLIAVRAARSMAPLRACLLVAAPLAAVAATAWGIYLPELARSRAIYTTLTRLETLTARTDDWIASHGRAPTPVEWEALAGPLARDGWGKPLRYEADGRASLGMEGRMQMPRASALALERWRYLIRTDHGKGSGGRLAYGDLHNWQLGADGLFGTDDDSEDLRYLSGRRPLMGFLPHGRQARGSEALRRQPRAPQGGEYYHPPRSRSPERPTG